MNRNDFNCAFHVSEDGNKDAKLASRLSLLGYSVGVVLRFVGFGSPYPADCPLSCDIAADHRIPPGEIKTADSTLQPETLRAPQWQLSTGGFN